MQEEGQKEIQRTDGPAEDTLPPDNPQHAIPQTGEQNVSAAAGVAQAVEPNVSAAAGAAHTRYCQNCGAPLKVNSKFCENCGSKI